MILKISRENAFSFSLLNEQEEFQLQSTMTMSETCRDNRRKAMIFKIKLIKKSLYFVRSRGFREPP